MARRLETLKSKIEQLQAEVEKLERTNEKGIKAVLNAMRKHGVSLEDLQAHGGKRTNSLKGTKAPVRYRDKDGNEWSGRGRTPLWLVAHEKVGKKRESFEVKS